MIIKSIKIIGLFGILTLVLSWISVLPVHAASYNTINFRTIVIDQNRVTLADGNYDFGFAIFNSATGGSPLWSETHTGVATRFGSLSVELGESVPFAESIFKNNANLYLRVCFNTGKAGAQKLACGGTYEEEFSPRRKLNAVPFALRARNLGPAAISAGETAYAVSVTGSSGKLIKFDFNNLDVATLETNGNLALTDGTRTFEILPASERVNLTSGADLYFGSEAYLAGDSNTLSLYTSNAQRLKVDSSGNVGIGTGSPSTKLHVEGGYALFAPASSGYASFRLPTSGGINPTSPTSGDLWWNGTQLYFRTGSTSRDLLSSVACPTCVVDGGNSFGSLMSIGTNDAYSLSLETNNISALSIDTDQDISIPYNLGLWDAAPTSTSFLRIDNSTRTQDSGNLFPIRISAVNNSTGGSTRGILTEVSTGLSNTPGTMSNYRGVLSLDSSASYGEAFPNELFFTGMSSRVNGNAGTLINQTYVSAYDANIDNMYDTGFDTDISNTGTLSFYRGVGVNVASVNGLYLSFLQMTNEVAGDVNSFTGDYISMHNKGSVDADMVGNYVTLTADGTFASDIAGEKLIVSGAGTASGNLYGSSISLSGSPTVGGNVVGFDLGTSLSGSAVNLYGLRMNWGTESVTNTHYGAYIEAVSAGTVANYGIYVGGASGGSGNNASIWVDTGLTRLGAATADLASLRITSGLDPSVPVSGDLWWNGTQLYFYNGSSNVNLLAGGGGTPGGSDGQVQYNNGGAFGGDADLFWDDGSNRLGVTTSSPNATLSLGGGTGANKLAIWDGGAGVTSGFGQLSNLFVMHLAGTSERFGFYDSEAGSEIMTLDGVGKLGLGITSPASKIDATYSVSDALASLTGYSYTFSSTGNISGNKVGSLFTSTNTDATNDSNALFAGIRAVTTNSDGSPDTINGIQSVVNGSGGGAEVLSGVASKINITGTFSSGGSIFGSNSDITIDNSSTLDNKVVVGHNSYYTSSGTSSVTDMTLTGFKFSSDISAGTFDAITGLDLSFGYSTLPVPVTHKGINLADIGFGTTSNYGINLGDIGNASVTSGANYGLSISSVDYATSQYGINLGNVGANSSATTAYGMRIGSVTGTTSYGLYINSASGTTSTELYIVRGGTNGIYFGNGGAEGANDIVTQDGTLNITGAVAMSGACSDTDGGDGGADGCDLAETFASLENLQRGEVVRLASNVGENWKLIARTTSRSDKAIGVISTNPTIVMGNNPFKDQRSYPVGLAGILPTQVTSSNGMIKRGDYVTISDVPGKGMKANLGDYSIGVAMQDQTQATETINVLINQNQGVVAGATTDVNQNLEQEMRLLIDQIRNQMATMSGTPVTTSAPSPLKSGNASIPAGQMLVKIEPAGLNPGYKVFITFSGTTPKFKVNKEAASFTVELLEAQEGSADFDYLVLD